MREASHSVLVYMRGRARTPGTCFKLVCWSCSRPQRCTGHPCAHGKLETPQQPPTSEIIENQRSETSLAEVSREPPRSRNLAQELPSPEIIENRRSETSLAEVSREPPRSRNDNQLSETSLAEVSCCTISGQQENRHSMYWLQGLAAHCERVATCMLLYRFVLTC